MGFKKGNQLGKQNKGRKRIDASIRMKGNTLWKCNIGRKRTEEFKKKISKSVKKRYRSGEKFGFQKGELNISKKIDIRKINSEKHKGKTSWNKGKPYLALDKHWNWKGGISFEPYPTLFNKKLKKLVIERDKFECKLFQNKNKILYVHHIDYNKKNCNPENLITLCPSCHTKTNYNRNKWMKFFKNEK